MAAKSPKDPKNQGNKDKKRSWLSTDDWLGVAPAQTPAPLSSTKLDAGQTTDRIPAPEDAIGGELTGEGPGSVLPLGREKRQLPKVKPSETPSAIIAKADLAEMTTANPQPDDDAIDLATPPGGATTGPPSLSKILKATGTKSDIIHGGKGVPDGSSYTPTTPGSGWLTGSRAVPGSGSRVDIGNAPRTVDESDIFANASSDQAGASGSNLLPGMSGIGRSSVFSDSRSGTGLGAGAESDLFAGLTGVGDRGSSLFDDSAKKTQKVAPAKDDEDIFRALNSPGDSGNPSDAVPLMGEDVLDPFDARPLFSGPPSSAKLADRLLAELADSGGFARPDFNAVDKSASGSNLFDDVTAMDIDLGPESGISGTSGLNWLDPNRTGTQDSGPGSSIFHKPGTMESSDPGRVDLSQIPLMGSTDDTNDMAQLSDLAGPPSSVLKKELQKAMRELKAEGGISFDLPEVSDGSNAWGTPHSAIDPEMSMHLPVTDDELELAAPPSGGGVGLPKVKSLRKDSDSVFDDVLVGPEESGILVQKQASMSGSILQGMTSDKLRFQNETTQVAPPTRAKSPGTDALRVERRPARSKRGWLVAGASLAAGVASGAGGMYLAHTSFSKPGLTEGQQIAAAGAERWSKQSEAERALAAGDPDAALIAYRLLKTESPEIKAGRGQATWMARLRETAGKNQKLSATDAAVTAARADLQGVLEHPEGLLSPEEQKAGLRAALNLGLIHEATGKPNEAIKVYKEMAVKLPAFKKVFDSAGRRVTLMLHKTDGSKLPDNQYSIAAGTLWNLADANRILLDFDTVQVIEDEAGFHFWEAVGYASTVPGSYTEALKSLDLARTAHATRRHKLIGMGLNPLSDPTEQIFLKTCDELKTLWTMKRQLYADPVVKAAGGKSTEAILKDLLAAQGNAKVLPAELAALTKKAADAEAATQTALKEREAAESSAKTLRADHDALAKQVADLNRTMADAKAAATTAAEKLKATEAALDPLFTKLKGAKLIDGNATREQALAALPKIAVGGANADLAKELATLTDRYTAETADAKKKITALETAVKDVVAKSKSEREKAVAAVRTEQEAKITALANEARTAATKAEQERLAFEQKKREIEEAFQVQLTAARAGAAVVVSDLERAKNDQADRAFANGVEDYNAGRFSGAERFFEAAVSKNPNDARYWYFLGLAKFQQTRDASEAFKKGADLEARNLPNSNEISMLLIDVQGAARLALNAARP